MVFDRGFVIVRRWILVFFLVFFVFACFFFLFLLLRNYFSASAQQ